MNNTFKREQRYLVIKVKDAKHYLGEDQLEQLAGIADTIEVRRKAVGLPGLECVVIESHWPEYEATWKAIEARVTGAQAQPASSNANDDDLYWRLHSMSKSLESSGLIDEYNNPDAYGTVLDAMNYVRRAPQLSKASALEPEDKL